MTTSILVWGRLSDEALPRAPEKVEGDLNVMYTDGTVHIRSNWCHDHSVDRKLLTDDYLV